MRLLNQLESSFPSQFRQAIESMPKFFLPVMETEVKDFSACDADVVVEGKKSIPRKLFYSLPLAFAVFDREPEFRFLLKVLDLRIPRGGALPASAVTAILRRSDELDQGYIELGPVNGFLLYLYTAARYARYNGGVEVARAYRYLELLLLESNAEAELVHRDLSEQERLEMRSHFGRSAGPAPGPTVRLARAAQDRTGPATRAARLMEQRRQRESLFKLYEKERFDDVVVNGKSKTAGPKRLRNLTKRYARDQIRVLGGGGVFRSEVIRMKSVEKSRRDPLEQKEGLTMRMSAVLQSEGIFRSSDSLANFSHILCVAFEKGWGIMVGREALHGRVSELLVRSSFRGGDADQVLATAGALFSLAGLADMPGWSQNKVPPEAVRRFTGPVWPHGI